MSDFSDFLERLIQEDGYSVYGFAQEAGVDRPTLHRVLKGQLVPSAPFFQKVVGKNASSVSAGAGAIVRKL